MDDTSRTTQDTTKSLSYGSHVEWLIRAASMWVWLMMIEGRKEGNTLESGVGWSRLRHSLDNAANKLRIWKVILIP